MDKYDKKQSVKVRNEMKRLSSKLKEFNIEANFNQLMRLDNTLISCHVNLYDLNLSNCDTVDDVIDKVRCL